MTSGEPGRAEVLGWMRRCTSRNRAIEAARHFYPGASPEQHNELAVRYRKWWQLHGESQTTESREPQGSQREPAPGPTARPVVARPAAKVELARRSPIERLELQVAELWADLEMARTTGDLRLALLIDRALAERAAELDQARARAARVLRLERTPTQIATELAKRERAIALRAEMERRKLERAAQAAQQQKERDL